MKDSYKKVIEFWFITCTPKDWFRKDPELDQRIKTQFGDLHAQAAACECVSWRNNALGRLAEIIVLDQFSRNIFRDTAQAFAYDNIALVLAQEAIKVRHRRRN